MKPFHLEILTPENPFFVGDCLSVNLPLTDGMLCVNYGHTPLSAAIHDGLVIIRLPDESKVECAVSRGMFIFKDNVAELLCDYAYLPCDIDAEKEKIEMEEALRAMKEKQSHVEYVMSQLTLAKAFNNLKIKKQFESNT